MTTLHPTPSSRGPFRRIPFWMVVIAAVLGGALLVGAGLLLTNGKDDKPASSASPTCTPTATAVATPPTAVVTINVYNATERAGLAADTAEELKLRAFKVDDVANDPKKADVAGTAVVRYSGSATTARWVAAQVPDATLQKVSAKGRTGAKYDLVLGEGYTELATVADAKAAFVASAPRTPC